MNVKSTTSDSRVKTLAPHGAIEYRAGWLDGTEADGLMHRLLDEIEWQQRSIMMFGKRVMQPRLLDFQGDPGVGYSYSGDWLEARPWHPRVRALKDRLGAAGIGRFNSVLVNCYRDGGDCMGWHADDEPELGDDPVIASASIGGVRRFVVRRRSNHRDRFELSPGHGSLIVMRGDMQRHWQHQIPRTRRPVAARINLTFRRVMPRVPGRRRR